MKDKDSLLLLILLLAWFWLISKKSRTQSQAAAAPAVGVTPGTTTTADTYGNQILNGVDPATAILNLGSTQTANLVNSIASTGGAGSSGTSGQSNTPVTPDKSGGFLGPPFLPGQGGIGDNQPATPGQMGFTPINQNTQTPVGSIVFLQSGPSDPWQGGYDLITYADGSTAQQQHEPGQFSATLYKPLLDSSGNPIPEQVPGVGPVG